MYSNVIWVACKRNRQKDAETAEYNTINRFFSGCSHLIAVVAGVDVVVVSVFLLFFPFVVFFFSLARPIFFPKPVSK